MISPLSKLRKEFINNKLDAILISSVSNIVYLTNYSGFSEKEREAYLVILKNKQYILTDGRYTEAVKLLIPDFKLIEISSKNPVDKILKELKKKDRIKKVGFEGNNISFSEHKKLLNRFDDSNHQNFDFLRSVKTPDEIYKIEKACKLGDKTFKHILKKIKLRVSEKELANEIEFFIRQNKGDISFSPIVAFGKNSAIPHHKTSNQRLASNGQFVLLDFGVKLNNYCSDMTRTVFFGSPNTEQRKMYETVLASQSHAIQYLKSLIINQQSIPAKDIDKVARDYITSKGYETIPHSVGHGIGIDVHEAPHISPKSKDILKEGMVFSIEPGIYIPNFGGVRIENLVVLEKRKLRILTKSPRTLLTIK